MGIRDRWRQIRHWIGPFFCPIGDFELDRRRRAGDRALEEKVRTLEQYRSDQERQMNDLRAQRADCVRRIADLERRLDIVNKDRLDLLIQHTEKQQDDDPGLWMMKRQG